MPKKTTVPGTLANVTCPKTGKVVGFKFGVRLPRYRGNMLSLVNGYYVNVDGVEYPQSALKLEINGKPPRSFEEIKTAVWEHWNYQDTAYLYVEKEGGLAQGYHDITYGYCCTHSYMPPFMDKMANPNEEEKVFMPEMGHNLHHRRLLIV